MLTGSKKSILLHREDGTPVVLGEAVENRGPTIIPRCSGGACPWPGTDRCGHCQMRHYCSRECQKKEWPRHKLECVPSANATHWQCLTLDSLAECRTAAPTVKQEKAALLALLASHWLTRVRVLAAYASRMSDGTMDADLGALRDGSLSETQLAAFPVAPLDHAAPGHRVALWLFWAMVLRDWSGDETQRADTQGLVAMGHFFCNASPALLFDHESRFTTVAFPPATGQKYTVVHVANEGFTPQWQLDVAQRLHNYAYLFMLFSLVDGGGGDEPHFALSHTLMLRVVGKHAFLVQSYFGYYSAADWMDCAHPLQIQARSVEGDCWQRELQPQPRWRRQLKLRDVMALARDVDALASDTPSAASYANLTGVLFDALPPMRVLALRQAL